MHRGRITSNLLTGTPYPVTKPHRHDLDAYRLIDHFVQVGLSEVIPPFHRRSQLLKAKPLCDVAVLDGKVENSLDTGILI